MQRTEPFVDAERETSKNFEQEIVDIVHLLFEAQVGVEDVWV